MGWTIKELRLSLGLMKVKKKRLMFISRKGKNKVDFEMKKANGLRYKYLDKTSVKGAKYIELKVKGA